MSVFACIVIILPPGRRPKRASSMWRANNYPLMRERSFLWFLDSPSDRQPMDAVGLCLPNETACLRHTRRIAPAAVETTLADGDLEPSFSLITAGVVQWY